jgi:hypothetical protein
MEGSCSTGQSPQRAVVPVEEEEEEEEDRRRRRRRRWNLLIIYSPYKEFSS